MAIVARPVKYDIRRPSKGGYSAIVYLTGAKIIAEDADGEVISSGVAGTDDATVAQAAADYVADVVDGENLEGGKLLFGGGVFKFSIPVEVSGRCWVQGSGAHATRFESSASPLQGIFKNKAVTNTYFYGTFSDFAVGNRWVGSTPFTAKAGPAISIAGAEYLFCRNLHINGITGNGIEVDDAWVYEVENCELSHCSGHGLYGGPHVTAYVIARNNVIQTNAGNGIHLDAGTGHETSGNKFENNHNHIVLENAASEMCDISKNYMYGASHDSIHAHFSNSNIQGNEIYGGENGINLPASENNIVSGNWISGVTVNGILWAGHFNNIVDNNIIANSAVKAIYAASGGGNQSIISGNMVEGTAPIHISGALCDISRNYVGSAIVATGAAGNIVKDNFGYISAGEQRQYGGWIETATQDAFNSIDNPYGFAVGVVSVDIVISEAATSTSPNIDVGIGSSATTDYTNLFNDLPGETVGFYNSKIATPGTQTVPIKWESGSGNRYLNMSIKDAAATGMQARYTITVMGI